MTIDNILTPACWIAIRNYLFSCAWRSRLSTLYIERVVWQTWVANHFSDCSQRYIAYLLKTSLHQGDYNCKCLERQQVLWKDMPLLAQASCICCSAHNTIALASKVMYCCARMVTVAALNMHPTGSHSWLTAMHNQLCMIIQSSGNCMTKIVGWHCNLSVW